MNVLGCQSFRTYGSRRAGRTGLAPCEIEGLPISVNDQQQARGQALNLEYARLREDLRRTYEAWDEGMNAQ